MKRPALLLWVALVVTGCSLFGGNKGQPLCPDVLILKEAGRLVKFAEGRGRDLTDIRFQARFADFRGNCDYEDDTVVLTLFVSIGVERGPANRTKKASFEYFAAVPKFHPQPQGKRRFRVTVPFEGSQTRVMYRDELTLTIPLKKGEAGPSFDVFLGFQLTPAELKFNRTRKTL